MVAALEPLAAVVPGLSVNGYPNPQASPPHLDIYPDNPFQEGAGMGVSEKLLHWIVRVRVNAADPKAAADLLYRFLDTSDPASVEAALAPVGVVVPADGSVDALVTFTDDNAGDLLGARWRVAMFV